MEATLQPQSSEVARDTNFTDSLTYADQLNNAQGECNASNGSLDFSPSEGGEYHGTVNESDTSDSSQYQLVLYDPAVNGAGNGENALDPPPLRRPHPFSDRTPRVLPSIGVFAVQCANCFKWRLVPTKEKYEEIREHIIAQPFVCETAREWRADISCDDPPDITQDGSRLWAIDKPNIAQPPPGWQRLLRIRGEGGSKFADVYYVAPSGKTLRSIVEIRRYLEKHPEYMTEDLSLSRFSFQIPKPLQENYVRKRSARPALRPALANDTDNLAQLPPTQVARLTWVDADVDGDEHSQSQLAKRTRANIDDSLHNPTC